MSESNMPVKPMVLVMFGITGDLAGRKLLPAVYELARKGQLADEFFLVGITRRGTTADEVTERIRGHVGDAADETVLDWLRARIKIITMDLTLLEPYQQLKAELDAYSVQCQAEITRLHYLAIPAQSYAQVVDLLGQAGLSSADNRLLIEKPFGHDLASANNLIRKTTEHFEEKQIYRIDHYLAKSAAQAVLPFRSRHAELEAMLNREHVASITVTATETIGIEGRSVFYEETGALRDVLQSHLLQLLPLVTMDLPSNLTPDDIHAEKLRLLQSIASASPKQAVRGQYEGYRNEVNNPDSRTETFAALELTIANDRWQGVPVRLITGKRLSKKLTEINVLFTDGRQLVAGIDPSRGIMLQGISDTTLDEQPEGYERVLLDAAAGDQTLFVTSPEVLAAWQIVEPIVQTWDTSAEAPEPYEPGSGGPALPI